MSGFEWFRPEDLGGADVPENVRAGARRAIEYFEAER
jgi:hypothetical protein